jgi:hypothetical protein
VGRSLTLQVSKAHQRLGRAWKTDIDCCKRGEVSLAAPFRAFHAAHCLSFSKLCLSAFSSTIHTLHPIVSATFPTPTVTASERCQQCGQKFISSLPETTTEGCHCTASNLSLALVTARTRSAGMSSSRTLHGRWWSTTRGLLTPHPTMLHRTSTIRRPTLPPPLVMGGAPRQQALPRLAGGRAEQDTTTQCCCRPSLCASAPVGTAQTSQFASPTKGAESRLPSR